MGKFKTWLESTARKRRVNAAAETADRGAGERLPGSEANVHGTNVKAHLSIGEKGEVGEKPVFGKKKKKAEDEDDDDSEDDLKENVPNRSFDAFVKKAEDLKASIPEIMKRAKKKEGELDKKEDELKKDTGPTHGEEDDEGEYHKKWKDLQQIAKERDKDNKDEKESDDESSDSDGAT